MSPFNFHAIQTLEISSDDHPKIDVQHGRLVLTATRGSDQIMITAPLNSVIPAIAKTTVKIPQKATSRKPRATHTNVKCGEDHRLSKLTEADVRRIRELATDASYLSKFNSKYALIKEMGILFKVHYSTIVNILTGKTWKHVQ